MEIPRNKIPNKWETNRGGNRSKQTNTQRRYKKDYIKEKTWRICKRRIFPDPEIANKVKIDIWGAVI